MKILLIFPSSETPFKLESEYPLGVLYLASILEKEGHQVLVRDYYESAFDETKDKMINLIKNYSPDIVGLSCVTMNRISCFKIAKIVKKINPHIKVIMGGVHTVTLYEQILKNFPVDAIVIGEGEETTPELINAFEKNKTLKRIKGIAFKEKGEVFFTGRRDFKKDLNEIPFPKHELLEYKIKKSKVASIITSRGCPFNCIFCSTSSYWGVRWRPRSAENVTEEIEYLTKRFPYLKKIIIQDDTFVVDNQRVIDICNRILERGIKINWECSGRIDRITEEMLIKMKEAGCKKIYYGVESGSKKMLETIEKKITREQIKKTIDITNKVGLAYGAYLMVGNPGETWETVKESNEFLQKLDNLKINSIGKLEIYPNTKIYEIAKKQGIIEDSYWITEKKVPHYTFEHSVEELTEMAYYLVAKNQLKQGVINFFMFGFKFFLAKPRKAIRYLLLKIGLIS